MQVGDLVICTSVVGRPMGLIVEVFRSRATMIPQYRVKIHGHDNIYPFLRRHLEVVNASR